MQGFLQDLSFGIRVLRKNSGFTLLAVAILALGIGANAAIFSVVQGVLLNSLPYEDPQRLVLVWESVLRGGATRRSPTSPANFLDWTERSEGVSQFSALRNSSLRLTAIEPPIVPLTHMVTANYFETLGVEPLLGRSFAAGEDQPGRDRVAMISYGLWQRVYGGDPAALGSQLELDGEEYTLVGVLDDEFYSAHLFPTQPDLWVPLSLAGEELDRRNRNLIVFARLDPGVRLSQVQASLDSVATNLAREHPESNADSTIRAEPIREDIVGSYRQTFVVLLAAVGFVLLLACANVANMILTRASQRSREIVVRRALGAGRWRLLRQLTIESLLLTGAGGALGVALASFGLQPMLTLIPSGAGIPFLDRISLDGSVLLFAFALSLATAVFFGMTPAWQISRWNLSERLKTSGRGVSGARAKGLHRPLVVAQVAIALLLLAGAGLILQSFRHLTGYDPGFDVERVLTIRNSVRGERFSQPDQVVEHFRNLSQRLGSLPGAESASGVSFPPPNQLFRPRRFRIEGQPVEPGSEPRTAVRVVLADYFSTMGIPMIQGRGIEARDRSDSLPTAVVNHAFAQRYFAPGDAVGSLISLDRDQSRQRRIVGVSDDVLFAGMRPEPSPMLYLPHPQSPLPIMSFVIRASDDPRDLAVAAEREAWKWNSTGGNVYNLQTFEARLADQHWRSRLSSFLLGGFALLSLILGAAGIYAVISSSVSRRVTEIGIRAALGARRSHIRRMVIGEGLKLSALGIAIGLAASMGMAKLIGGQLYGIQAHDPLTLILVSIGLLGVAIAACLVPAIRAMRIDPIQALRSE